MNRIYLNRYVDWLLLTIIFIKSLITVSQVTNTNSSMVLSIGWSVLALSAITFIALLLKNKFTDLLVKLFIIVTFLLPSLLIIYRYLVDLVFYGINRIELLQPYLLVQFLLGIVLFVVIIKFKSIDGKA